MHANLADAHLLLAALLIGMLAIVTGYCNSRGAGEPYPGTWYWEGS